MDKRITPKDKANIKLARKQEQLRLRLQRLVGKHNTSLLMERYVYRTDPK